MKLLKCYIENFGKFHKYALMFNQDLNIFYKENGWGKTTFTVFIKAMFYGLSTYKGAKDFDENERKKYLPWQGGVFGGNLDFEINGKRYRIERFFGRTYAEDTFSLTDLATNKPSRDYSENIGEELFDLDADGFQRTVFIPQKDLESNMNESIAQKLTNLIQGTNSKYNYETAQNILDDQRRALLTQHKTGRIAELRQQIQEQTNRINELTTRTAIITRAQKEIETQDAVIADLSQKLRRQTVTDKSQQRKDYVINTILVLASACLLCSIVMLILEKTSVITVQEVVLWTFFIIGAIALLTSGITGVVIHLCRKKKQKSVEANLVDQVALEYELNHQREMRMQNVFMVQRAQDDLAMMTELENNKNALQIELTALEQDYDALVNAKRFLEEAHEALKTNFLAPMENGLKKYLFLITGKNYANLQLDTNFNVALMEYGSTRAVDYYSKGYQNTFELCLRLALIDAIFTKEKPFIILDDPFVNLDAAKIANAKMSLVKLAKECQILYFSCHTSRC